MKRHSKQRGMSLVVAIFLITVIASLAAFAVTVGTATNQSANLQLRADRAMSAARAGAEWGAHRALLVVPVCPVNPVVFNLNQGALRGFRVTVTCAARGAAPNTVFDITSFAQQGNFGSANYASRTVTRRVW
jgi:MSHA biogenesis protein MshP